MLYQRKIFSCPAAGRTTTEQNWDRAFLSAEAYIAKYGESPDGQASFVNLGPAHGADSR